jgi:TonB family protein
VETAEVWPPKGGLPAGEDPFDTRAVVATPEFLPPGASSPSDTRRINVERAFAVSVILHLLLVIALLTVKFPARSAAQDQVDPLGLQKLMAATPQDSAIPVQLFPGARAKQPGPKPVPSDMDRQAHGGDRSLPVLPVPKAYPQSGIRDLEAGKRGQAAAAAPAAQPPQGSLAGVEGKKLTDLAPGGSLHDPPTAEERAARQRLLGIQAPDLNAITADAARQAAKSGGGGDEGGGFERDGGFVDSGPLSFDTVGYDWGAYAAEMIRKIKRNWDVPALARYGVKGRLTIRFFILKDGRVEGERILSGSGVPPFDNAAFQAIARSSAFRPLPDDLGHDREGVTVTFFYNLRPEDVEYAGKGRPN